MKDADVARRLRIANGLNAVWFIILCCLVALLAGDLLAGVLGIVMSSLSYGAAVLWMSHADLLPAGRLSTTHKRVLQIALPAALSLGLSTVVLGQSDNDLAAGIVAAVGGVLAVAVGAFSVWLAVH